jgi:hypothetical protein
MKALKRFFGIEVVVRWEDTIYRHYVWNEDEALDWVRQYPKEAKAKVNTWIGYTIYARG